MLEFKELTNLLNFICTTKVWTRLKEADWKNKAALRESLESPNLIVKNVDFFSRDGILKSVAIDCYVILQLNEVPGVNTPFICSLYTEGSFDEKTKKYEMGSICTPTLMVSQVGDITVYKADDLHDVWGNINNELDVSLFVSESFDFESVCKEYGYNPVECEKSVEKCKPFRLEVIEIVKFSDFMIPAIGKFMDEYFAKEGWELQLVKATDGIGSGYQVFFGPGVQVDNNYEYGFYCLFELADVVAFAEYFYESRGPKNRKEDLQ